MYEIETVVKPILEELGMYGGNDVSAKLIFEKYLDVLPRGIKPFWKFQVIVKYELSLFEKTTTYDGVDYVETFSCRPEENTHSNGDPLEFFKSMIPLQFYYIHDDKSLIDYFLSVYENYYDEYECPNNKLYRYERLHEQIAMHWLQYGKHDPDIKNTIVLRGQKIWDQFIKNYVCWNSKIDWIGFGQEKKVDIKRSFRRWL
ncbi:MAG: hypothetical protein LBV17_03995 [Treponema sp.]|jgi:hypothetical protein|nr:hypothetical protein [Treponema sp.]